MIETICGLIVILIIVANGILDNRIHKMILIFTLIILVLYVTFSNINLLKLPARLILASIAGILMSFIINFLIKNRIKLMKDTENNNDTPKGSS